MEPRSGMFSSFLLAEISGFPGRISPLLWGVTCCPGTPVLLPSSQVALRLSTAILKLGQPAKHIYVRECKVLTLPCCPTSMLFAHSHNKGTLSSLLLTLFM